VGDWLDWTGRERSVRRTRGVVAHAGGSSAGVSAWRVPRAAARLACPRTGAGLVWGRVAGTGTGAAR